MNPLLPPYCNYQIINNIKKKNQFVLYCTMTTLIWILGLVSSKGSSLTGKKKNSAKTSERDEN